MLNLIEDYFNYIEKLINKNWPISFPLKLFSWFLDSLIIEKKSNMNKDLNIGYNNNDVSYNNKSISHINYINW